MCSRVGPPVYSQYILAGFVVLAHMRYVHTFCFSLLACKNIDIKKELIQGYR